MAKRRLSIQQQRRINRKHRPVNGRNTLPDEEKSGLVVARFGNQADVKCLDHSYGDTVCRCHIRANVQDIVTGDRVQWQPGMPTGVITAVSPRETLMSRPDSRGRLKPVAANVTQIAIVIALEPEAHQNLVDRYLVAIEHFNIQPLLVINKVDLIEHNEGHLERLIGLYQNLGYPVFQVSAKLKRNLHQLVARLDHHTTVFVGQSGVGKSSLVNLICPEAEAAIGKLSNATKGRHTTTSATLYELSSGGYLIDSPGIREFGLWHLSVPQVAYGFIEFRKLLGNCRFRNCLHLNEPGCAILEACENQQINTSRLRSYQQIVNELNES